MPKAHLTVRSHEASEGMIRCRGSPTLGLARPSHEGQRVSCKGMKLLSTPAVPRAQDVLSRAQPTRQCVNSSLLISPLSLSLPLNAPRLSISDPHDCSDRADPASASAASSRSGASLGSLLRNSTLDEKSRELREPGYLCSAVARGTRSDGLPLRSLALATSSSQSQRA